MSFGELDYGVKLRKIAIILSVIYLTQEFNSFIQLDQSNLYVVVDHVMGQVRSSSGARARLYNHPISNRISNENKNHVSGVDMYLLDP
jgi:hypothetical protein